MENVAGRVEVASESGRKGQTQRPLRAGLGNEQRKVVSTERERRVVDFYEGKGNNRCFGVWGPQIKSIVWGGGVKGGGRWVKKKGEDLEKKGLTHAKPQKRRAKGVGFRRGREQGPPKRLSKAKKKKRGKEKIEDSPRPEEAWAVGHWGEGERQPDDLRARWKKSKGKIQRGLSKLKRLGRQLLFNKRRRQKKPSVMVGKG